MPALVSSLDRNLEHFTREGFAPFVEIWNRHDPYLGEDVVLEAGETTQFGQAQGVSSDGSLILKTLEGKQEIHSGELFPSLRPSEESAGRD